MVPLSARKFRLALLAGLLAVLCAAVPSYAKCDPTTDPDKSDIANARAAVAANCDCAGATTHGAYVSCAAQQANTVLTNKSCAGAVKKCASHSTCGKPGAVTCCLTTTKGTKCKSKKDAAHCTAKQGTVGSCTSCCDACPAPGSGPSCPAGSTTTTTSTPSTTSSTVATCANGGLGCGANCGTCGTGTCYAHTPACNASGFYECDANAPPRCLTSMGAVFQSCGDDNHCTTAAHVCVANTNACNTGMNFNGCYDTCPENPPATCANGGITAGEKCGAACGGICYTNCSTGAPECIDTGTATQACSIALQCVTPAGSLCAAAATAFCGTGMQNTCAPECPE